MIYDVIVVGMGPSGLMTGATLDPKLKVLMLDSNSGPGKKLLISGKGQCNYTNSEDIDSFENHYGSNGRFLRSALRNFSNSDAMNFFKEWGLDSVIREDGKVFPSSFEAQDVLNIFMEKIKSNGHEMKYNCKLIDFNEVDGIFHVLTEKGEFQGRYIVFATGGMSQPMLGSDGMLVEVLRGKGIKTVVEEPSLTPLLFSSSLKKLSGIAFDDVVLTCYKNKKKAGSFKGRMLITHRGISGPLVINNSRAFGNGDEISINFVACNRDDLDKVFIEDIRENGKWKLITFLRRKVGGSLTESFYDYLIDEIGLQRDTKISEISKVDRKKIITFLVDYRVANVKKGGFNVAMSTKGGVSLKEISPKDFQLKKIKNIFVIGEMIDIDGDTGGFNIQGCFSMGRLVGEHINSILQN